MTRSTRPAARSVGPPGARQEARVASVMVAPAVIFLICLVVLPLVWNLLISVQSLRLIELRRFGPLSIFDNGVTLANFRAVLARADFVETLLRTVLYAALGTVGSIVVGLWAALAMARPFPGRAVVRAVLLLPYVIPVVAAAFVWRALASPQYGAINAWLAQLGVGPIDFFGQRSVRLELFGASLAVPMSFTAVIIFEIWRYFPFAYIFIQARMQAISPSLFEAARVDGASVLGRFRHITLPSLSGVLILLIMVRFIWNFNDFTNVFLLTGGSAGTSVIAVEIYQWLVGRSDPGAASALSLVLGLILCLLLVIYLRVVARREVEA